MFPEDNSRNAYFFKMKQHYLTLLTCLEVLTLCLASGLCRAQAQTPVMLTEQQAHYKLGRALDYLEDPTGALTIADVTSPAHADRFVPSQQEMPNFGYTDAVYWARVRLRNTMPRTTQWRLELGFANMHYVDFYRPSPGQAGFDVIRTGALRPFATRDIPYHRFVFALTLPPDADHTVYLRFRNGASMTFPLTLWTSEAFIRASQTILLLSGLFYGTLLIMLGYNTVLWLTLRDRSYLYYVGFLTSIILGQATYEGFIKQYLCLDAWGGSRFLMPLFTVCISMASLKFMMTVLNTRQRTPRAHAASIGLLAIWILILVLLPFVSYGAIMQPLMIVRLCGGVFVLALSFVIWRQEYRPARYFFWAWLVASLSNMLLSLVRLGVVPSSIVTEHGYQVGVVLMMLLFSLSLADRIQLLREEKETAQLQAMNALQEQDRLVREQNLLLEQQVTARTEQLSRSNAQLIEAKDQADAANQAKSRFLANMSHELRTPLNAILGFAQLLRRSAHLDPGQQEFLDIISRSGDHLLSLINQVLDLSKIEAGRMTLTPTDCHIGRLLDDIEDMFRLKAVDKQVQLICERDPDLPLTLHLDEVKLRQVLINLLSNAVKFTTHGGIILRVSSVKQPTNQVRLRFEVEDTGPGIAPEELEKLFEPFEQTATGRQAQEGTGLGVPLSRKFVQLMDGDIQVQSQVGEGTTFRFEIDAERLAEDRAQVEESPPQRVLALEPGQPVYRLLVVDDTPANRLLLVKLLSPFGFELREATNGHEAIDIWEEWQPHLIWMDIRMPGLNGWETAKRIKATPHGQATVIIAVTASIEDDLPTKTLTAGCEDFLRKPFREQQVFDLLH
ncbi:response regulator, partial [candidate division KSB3 bacterium]|nr:response regulator [candidate division KSB3 bacterium]MBD3325637.1 response regulator [candidate division KSB3 bacterium]